MTWETSDENLWSESERHESSFAKGSEMLLTAQWNARPSQMWKLACAGKAVLPSHLRGLRLRPPKPKEQRVFSLDRRPPQIYYGDPDWVRKLIAAVAEQYGITVQDIKGQRRFAIYVEARRMIARALRDRGLSYPRIGFHLGGRDHSTAMNLVDSRRKTPGAPDIQGGEGE